MLFFSFFFFTATATSEIYTYRHTLSLPDALPIYGGYATHAVADAHFCFHIPDIYSDEEAAPLLCAGLIGWRSLRAAGDGRCLGLYGFGAAAHIIAQIAIWQGRQVYAFTKAGDSEGQDFARSLGCMWAGSSDEPAPAALDTAIIFAPFGALVPDRQ